MPVTVHEALRTAHAALEKLPSGATDAQELVSRAIGVTRARLLMERTRPLEPAEGRTLEAWVRRRLAGEPVQYITGRAAFRHLDLEVGPAVLIPRPETEGLVERVLEVLDLEAAKWSAPRVLDLGTGSGAIALAIASERSRAIVTATDASPAALALARGNADALGLAERVAFVAGDWFGAVGADDLFEVVVANPPYIATGEWGALPEDVRGHEPQEALFSGTSGLEALREIVDEAPGHLVAGGLLALELAEARAAEVAAWLDGAHDWSGVELRDDLTGRPRVLLARREAGPAIAPRQWPEDRG